MFFVHNCFFALASKARKPKVVRPNAALVLTAGACTRCSVGRRATATRSHAMRYQRGPTGGEHARGRAFPRPALGKVNGDRERDEKFFERIEFLMKGKRKTWHNFYRRVCMNDATGHAFPHPFGGEVAQSCLMSGMTCPPDI